MKNSERRAALNGPISGSVGSHGRSDGSGSIPGIQREGYASAGSESWVNVSGPKPGCRTHNSPTKDTTAN